MLSAIRLLILLGCCAGCAVSPVIDVQTQDTHNKRLEDLVAAGWTVSGPFSVDGVEAKELRQLEEVLQREGHRKDVPQVPFGLANDDWQDFKSRVQAGDEIHYVHAPPVRWASLSGWGGYVLVKHGRIIATMVTVIN